MGPTFMVGRPTIIVGTNIDQIYFKYRAGSNRAIRVGVQNRLADAEAGGGYACGSHHSS